MPRGEDALERLHAHRVVGGDRHHRHSHRASDTSGAKGPRSRLRSTCQNNLKQMGLACHSILDATGAFSANGWGWDWVGVPNKGYNNDQPGGWCYNMLNYIEQTALRKLGSGKTAAAFQDEMTLLITTPVPMFNCPTRRSGGPWPSYTYTYYSAEDSGNRRSLSTSAESGPSVLACCRLRGLCRR